MNFVYFSTLAWDEAGGAHNPTQMTRALAQRGHTILFVEPQPSKTRVTGNLSLEIVALTELGMSPNELRRAWFGLETGELETVGRELLARVPQQDARAAIFSAPFDPFVRLIPLVRAHNFLIVYDAMDDFASAPALGYTQFVAGSEEELTRSADVLLGVTQPIANSLARFGKRAQVLANGIDVTAFQKKNSRKLNLTRGQVTLGFWGTLMESLFDAELIAYVAESKPQWAIHLLGAVDPEAHRPSVRARLRNYPNIFFHGAVPHAELLNYAAAFDVALAPFPDNAFSRGRDPIKVYEYLAAHLPVVASYAPQLRTMPGVFVADSPQGFVEQILVAAQTRIDVNAVDIFLAQHTWDARAEEFLNIVRAEKSAPRESGEGAILPSFANPTTQAVMRYANALELELAQVQAWARELERAAQARAPRWVRVTRRILEQKTEKP